MENRKIAIGSDHAGFEYKEIIKGFLQTTFSELKLVDVGTHSSDSVDYPDFAHQVAEKVTANEVTLGILICGSGNGVCMAANKHKGVRAALCWTAEIARLSREHNDANIICIPARFVTNEVAKNMIDTFLSTSFEGGRHTKRAEKIDQ